MSTKKIRHEETAGTLRAMKGGGVEMEKDCLEDIQVRSVVLD